MFGRVSRRLAGMAVVGGIAVALTGDILARPAPPDLPPVVLVSQPAEREFPDEEEVACRLQASGQVEVRARVGGPVVAVHFKGEELVKKGQLLFELESAQEKAALRKAEAERRLAEVRQKFAHRALERGQKMFKEKAISREELDHLASVRVEADAVVEVARAGVEVAQLGVERTRVRAPLAGQIGEPKALANTMVFPGAGNEHVLAVIAVIQPIRCEFEQQSMQDVYLAQRLEREKPIRDRVVVQLSIAKKEGPAHTGMLAMVEGVGFLPYTGAMFLNPNNALLPGQKGRVRLTLGKSRKLPVVPDRAVIFHGQGSGDICVVNEKNVVERRSVWLGASVDGRHVIKSGLRSDEWVVVEGAQFLSSGDLVRPKRVALPRQSP